ncbi:MAG: endo alpha-1,4 polygalactosaminidase [Firmicutes bacterium]|nr:endo alpha-1,4 polygalactosaminidase [Bacillota bacterium]
MPLRRRLPVRTFCVYYGHGPLPGIETFELAVLEPAGWTRRQLAELKARGTVPLAYVSVLEAPGWLRPRLGLEAGDLLEIQGKPWHKPEFDTWVIDPRSTRWRRHLQEHIGQLWEDGWEGLFLDTLGDVEDARAEPLSHWLVPQAADLVRMCRQLAGERFLAMNNGLWLLLPLVAPAIDAVAWEGFPSSAAEPWVQAGLERLLDTATRWGVQPMLLGTAPAGAAADSLAEQLRATAARYGFAWYVAPGSYTAGVRLPDGRVRPAPGRRSSP